MLISGQSGTLFHLIVLLFSTKPQLPNGAYGKAGNGNETETGNGNWKRKWEQKCTNHYS